MSCPLRALHAVNPDVFPLATGQSLKAAPVPLAPDAPFTQIDLQEEFDALDIGVSGTLLIAVIVLICSGLSAYLVAQLAVRIPF